MTETSMRDQLDIQTRNQTEMIDVSDQVERRVSASAVADGMCFVCCPHTTAGLTINENADPYVRTDFLHALDQLVPLRDPSYRHAEGNSAAHMKASLMGFSVAVPIVDGRLAFGTWQGIYLCEFDGPRTRRLTITFQASDS